MIGVGNLLLKDEGIGIHTVRALEAMNLPPDIKIVDGGTSPDLMTCTRAGDRLIIIDAARAGGAPGTIYRFHPGDLDPGREPAISLHELGLPQSLQLMSLTGSAPGEITIIGVEPQEIDWGLELSAELQRKVPEIVQTVLQEIGLDQGSTPGE